jgi:single-strand selective monofunctional uracil DNA glycosylase
LPAGESAPLYAACDQHLRALVAALQPDWVIGIGAFAEARAAQALAGSQVKIGRILHPSPASPAANRGWSAAASKQLETLGVW